MRAVTEDERLAAADLELPRRIIELELHRHVQSGTRKSSMTHVPSRLVQMSRLRNFSAISKKRSA